MKKNNKTVSFNIDMPDSSSMHPRDNIEPSADMCEMDKKNSEFITELKNKVLLMEKNG